MKAPTRSYLLSLAFLLVATLPAYAAQNDLLDQPVPTVLRAIVPERVEILGFIQKGVVVFKFTVTAAGDVSDVKLVSSSNNVLNDGAERTIEQWKFNPAIKHGERVSCTVIQTLNFN
ncbi:MAG TPA: energy transducer TonB [Opitutaceae bacterium]|nr:energy transducer TonB [Opitutaceae bacterium]